MSIANKSYLVRAARANLQRLYKYERVSTETRARECNDQSKRFIRFVLFATLTLIPFPSFAEIYRTVESDGTVVYSDQPDTKSEMVSLPNINVATQPATTQTTETTQTTDTTPSAKKKLEYIQFTINSPKDQETFQNATDIPVSISIKPSLQQNDKIQYLLDGNPVSDPITSTSFSIPKISGTKEIITRGTHTLSAQLINEEGNVIKTTPAVTIYAHYVTLFSPAH